MGNLQKLRLQLENIRKDLSMKSSVNHTHFSTLVYLQKNHNSRGIGNNVSIPNEPPKSQTENDSLDSSSGHSTEDKESSNIKLYGTDSEIQNFRTDFALLRTNLSAATGYKYTNLDVVDYLCKNYNDSVPHEPETFNTNNNDAKKTTLSPSFQNKDPSERKYFFATWNCIDDYGLAMNHHGKLCDGDIDISASEKRIGFTCKEKVYQCKKCKWMYRFMPTPRYKGRGVSDFSAAIAMRTSGGQVEDHKRFTNHFGMSLPSTNKFQKKDFKLDVLRKVIHNRATQVKEKNIAKAVETYGKGLLLNGDMAHGTRKNSKASTFTVMNPSTHEPLIVANVFREDVPIAQKHEAAGATEVCEEILRRGLWVNGLCVDRGSKAKKPFKTAFGSPLRLLKRLETSKLIHGKKQNSEIDNTTAEAHHSKVVDMEMADQEPQESRSASNCSAGLKDALASFAFTSPLEETSQQTDLDSARFPELTQQGSETNPVNERDQQDGFNGAISEEETRQQAGMDVQNPPDSVPTKTATVDNPNTCSPIIINDDLWHDTTKLEKFLQEELKMYHRFDDKIILLKKHFYVCIDLCVISEQDYRDPEKLEAAKDKLRKLLLQSANHFQGGTNHVGEDPQFHEGCHLSSACRQKKAFCMSSSAISAWEANHLRSVIKKTLFYQHPENYLLGLNTSVVESFHNIQNMYRNKNTTYSNDEYASRLDIATMHFDEVIKGKYENGEKAKATEYSKGPKHLPKKTVAKREFIPKIEQDYFDEMFLLDSSEPTKKSRKQATPKVPSGLGVKEGTHQVMDVRKPDSNKEESSNLTQGSETLDEGQRNIVLQKRDVKSSPDTTTPDVVSTRTSPTTISSNRTVTNTNVGETLVNELTSGPTSGGSVGQKSVAHISGVNTRGSRQIIARRATVLEGRSTVTMTGYGNNGNISSQQAMFHSATIRKPQPVTIQRLHQCQSVLNQPRLNHPPPIKQELHHQQQPVINQRIYQNHPAIRQRLNQHQTVIKPRSHQHEPIISHGIEQHHPVISQGLYQNHPAGSHGLDQYQDINKRLDQRQPVISQRLDQRHQLHPAIRQRLDQHQAVISQGIHQREAVTIQVPTRHQPVINQESAHNEPVAYHRPPQQQPVKIQNTYKQQVVGTSRPQPPTITILSPRNPIAPVCPRNGQTKRKN